MNNTTGFYGILFDCPVGKRLKDCPFYMKDHLSFKEKIQWIDGLNQNEQESIINYHIEY